MRWMTFLLVWTNSLQATVLVPGPGVSDIEYRAALKADPDLQSPTQVLRRRQPEGRENLLGLFAEAQKSFLENSRLEAQTKFQNLVALLPTEDWTAADRALFQLAYLRLAQMEVTLERQDYWLTRSLLTGDDLVPEEKLFPPPLLKRWKQIRDEIPRFRASHAWFRERWDTVLVNGVPCTKTNCQGWPLISENVHLTFLSDQWVPQRMKVEAAKLAEVFPKMISWVEGSCSTSQFHAEAASIPERRAFWGYACANPSKQTATAAINFQPGEKPGAIPRLHVQERPRPFYKSKWLWIGLGVVTAGVILASSQKKEKDKEPSTTYGY